MRNVSVVAIDPFDAGEIEFSVSTGFSGWTYGSDEFDRYLRGWKVGATLRDNETEVITEEDLGRAQFVVVDTLGIHQRDKHPFDAFDTEGGDLYTFGATLYGKGSAYADDLEEGPLLVFQRAWVDPRYRGFGLGPVLAAVGLHELLRGCAVAVCAPAPTESDLTGAARDKATAAIARTWGSLGFQPFRDGVWVLEPGSAPAEDGIEQALARLG